MSPTFHPDESWLVDYAVGRLDALRESFVATHLIFCPACRAEVKLHEVAAAQAWSQVAVVPSPTKDQALLQALQGMLDLPETPAFPSKTDEVQRVLEVPLASGGRLRLPHTLRNLTPPNLVWHSVDAGLALCDLVRNLDQVATLRLLELHNQGRIARHRHAGPEYTLVLTGTLLDRERNHAYKPGDFIHASSESTHAFELGNDGNCICLYATCGRVEYG